jgi:hypothetical protein
VVVRAPKPGQFTNVAQATAERGVTARAMARTHFESAAGPAAEVERAGEPPEVGRRTTYTVRLLNPGPTAFRVGLAVTVPEQMKVLGPLGPTTARTEGQTVRFDPLETLEANAEKSYTVEVEAVKAGEVSLRVELTDGRAGPPAHWEEKVTIHEAPRITPRAGSPALQAGRPGGR